MTGRSKNKITGAAHYIVLAIIVAAVAILFQWFVRQRLWHQSVASILEETRQGANTLSVQLKNAEKSLIYITDELKDAESPADVESSLKYYSAIQPEIKVYLEDGTVYPVGAGADKAAFSAVTERTDAEGVIDPHISSASGVNVFDIYVRGSLRDGTDFYVLKEFQVNEVRDSFTLSFYDGTGFSYVIGRDGTILIRPDHVNSNSTVRNLFDAIDDPDDVSARIMEAMEAGQTGWAVLSFQGQDTFFGYRPVDADTDWYLISIIPTASINNDATVIVKYTFILMGIVIACIIVAMIITMMHGKKAADRIREQFKYTRHILDTVSESISILEASEPFEATWVNSAGLEMIGYPGVDLEDISSHLKLEDVIYPDDREGFLAKLKSVRDGAEKESFECRIMKPDGSIIWAAGVIGINQDADGNPAIMVSQHDVTARKLSESADAQKRRRERKMLTTAVSEYYPFLAAADLNDDTFGIIYNSFEHCPDGIANAATCSGVLEYFRGMLHEDSRKEFGENLSLTGLRSALEGRRDFWCNVRMLMSDGKYHWASFSAIGLKEAEYSGTVIFMLRLIDEEKENDERQRQVLKDSLNAAQAASEAKSQFLSNMSHDIRTPLNAIIGMTAIVTRHLDDKEQVRDGLKKISLSGQHLLSLINDILDMSKIESGKIILQSEGFNFAELVSETTELIRTQANANGITLEADLSGIKNENVTGDRLRAQQIMLNIMSNAVKYTERGGSVKIQAKDSGVIHNGKNTYIFICSDTGIGMSEEYIEHLFEPFSRAEDSRTSRIAGTGLGMAITKNLVDLFGGTIQADSRLGEGTTITVTLPLEYEHDSTTELPKRWQGTRCMIVDDDLDTCVNTAEMLLDISLRAEYVTSGREAVDRVVEAKDTPDPFELVIVDWKMPEMDGIEVARRIRDKVGRDIPIIILTAYNWAEIEHEAHDAGVTAFLEKPFFRSRFCYLLNELEGMNTASGEEDVQEQQVSDFSGRRIMLVEDNEMNREIAEYLLGETGVSIDVACDGQEALNLFKASAIGCYDMIFMDVQMPVMNGYEATMAIRGLKREDALRVPIIAMTANVFDEDVQAALKAGMNDHCGKPIDLNKLYSVMNRFMKK